ncbi:VWA domain-containing protein [Saccharibacillus brassicae]|uniref:Tellurium resistance protein TerF n=1 Tax=Saccharibacillus brassicae TaxID=2583377 RepID=A0A4Y6UYC2_SACBS|nr:VWA domain-containing protein [Saccharibacillus brassicae]QDH22759.1 tellurium resistance protein TerF [Saccharibacillus brassicae]
MAQQPEQLVQGANTPLGSSGIARIELAWTSSPSPLDTSCFLLGPGGRVASDDDFIFYNQPGRAGERVALVTSEERGARFEANLADLQAGTIEKFVFAAALEGTGTFAQVEGFTLTVEYAGRTIACSLAGAGQEAALVLAEIYAYKDTVKLRPIGRGFDGGLGPLAQSFGVDVEGGTSGEEVAEPKSSASPVPPEPPVIPEIPVAPVGRIDLLKKKVAVTLEKKRISRQKGKVAVVFDASGSMNKLYKNGTVQRAFERILAIAASLDDDGMLDVWMFALEFVRAQPASAGDYEGYVNRVYPFKGAGGRNNEPAVMEDVIRKFTVEEPDSAVPVYVVFFSDGGVSETKKISRLLTESSLHPIFWQFVGLGESNYGVLRKLDDLPGRLVDNAGFFALDDIDTVSDEDLYDRLFEEFPDWLNEARSKNILRDGSGT